MFRCRKRQVRYVFLLTAGKAYRTDKRFTQIKRSSRFPLQNL